GFSEAPGRGSGARLQGHDKLIGARRRRAPAVRRQPALVYREHRGRRIRDSGTAARRRGLEGDGPSRPSPGTHGPGPGSPQVDPWEGTWFAAVKGVTVTLSVPPDGTTRARTSI